MATTANDRFLGPGSNLRDRLSFPTFGDCPHEFDLDRRYLQVSDTNPNMATHKRHWCFLGEIDSVLSQDKLELLVRDTGGRTVRLECLSKDRGKSIASQANCKPGNTIAVLYALQHPFEDQHGYLALGPDDNTDIAILPYSLQQLLVANDKLWGQHHASCAAVGCGKSKDLLACAGCRLVRYCSKEHQNLDWKYHKQTCKAASALKWFTDKDWTRFESYWSFHTPF